MENLLFSINIIFPLFIMIIVGYFLARIRLVSEDFISGANKITFNVFLPILLFYNISKSDFIGDFNWQLVLYSVGSVLAVFLLAAFLVPFFVKDRKRAPVIIQGIFRGNFILFGVPICQSIYGEQGAALAAMVAAFVIPVLNVLAVIILSGYNEENQHSFKKILKSVVLNPLIIGSVLGIIVSLPGLWTYFPYVVTEPVRQLASIATPFALIILGCSLKLRNVLKNIKALSLITLCKVVLIPIVGLSVGYLLGFRNVEYAVLIAVFGSPVAISSQIMARRENLDGDLAGECIAMTALCAIVTFFLIIYISKLTGLLQV